MGPDGSGSQNLLIFLSGQGAKDLDGVRHGVRITAWRGTLSPGNAARVEPPLHGGKIAEIIAFQFVAGYAHQNRLPRIGRTHVQEALFDLAAVSVVLVAQNHEGALRGEPAAKLPVQIFLHILFALEFDIPDPHPRRKKARQEAFQHFSG